MAVEYIGKGGFTSGTGALTVGTNSSVLTGDLLLLLCESENEAVTVSAGGYTEAPSSPIGIGTAKAAGATRLTAFYKFSAVDGAATANQATVDDSGDHTCGIIFIFRNVDSTNPFNQSANDTQTSASSTATFPAVTTTSDGCMIVNCIAMNRDSASTTNLSSWANANLASITEAHDQTISTADGGGLGMAYGILNTAGSSGQTTATIASQVFTMITYALKDKDKGIANSKTLTSQVTVSASSVRSIARTVTASVSAVIGFLAEKSGSATEYTKALTASVSALVTARRGISKTTNATVTGSATVQRATNKTTKATVTASASASSMRTTSRVLQANINASATVNRAITKITSALVSVSANRKSAIQRTITATIQASASVQRVAYKSITILVSVSITLTRAMALSKVLSATVGTVSTITRAISKTTTANVTLLASRVSGIVTGFVEKIYLTATHSLKQTIAAINRISTLALSVVLNKPLFASAILRDSKSTMTVTTSNKQEVTWKMGADPKGENLHIVLGETKTIELTVLTTTGTAADLTGATAKFRAEGFTTDKNCTIDNNVISVALAADDFTKAGSYGYEFRIKDALNNVDSLVRGKIIVDPRLVTTF